MLTLFLLLGAAAGVNAILGGEVEAVLLDDKSYFCADNCVFKGIYFSQMGNFCPKNEVIVVLDRDGDANPYNLFDCMGAKQLNGYSERPRSSREEPQECPLETAADASKLGQCFSYKSPGAGTEKVQWSDIEKKIKAATAPKSKEECAKEGMAILSECREKSGSFADCNNEASAAIKSCQGLQ